MRIDLATVLLLLWSAYFISHSLLASDAAKGLTQRRWPRLFARYRLFYNALAVLLLVPPVLLTRALAGPPLWTWTGPLGLLTNVLGGLALLALIAAPTGYDLKRFLGLSGADSATGGLAGEGLKLGGIHRFVRHPWYCLALILIWTRDMDAATLLSAGAISAYFVVGSRLEENKLIAAYGDAYRRYRRRVPGLLPWPGRVLGRAEAAELEAQARQAERPARCDADGAQR